jgi:hypothetical protein
LRENITSDQPNNQNKNLSGLQNAENGSEISTKKTEILSQDLGLTFGKKQQDGNEMSEWKPKKSVMVEYIEGLRKPNKDER